MLSESQKHFEDYEIQQEVSKDLMHARDKRVYVGDYYYLNVSPRDWIKLKIKLCVIMVLIFAAEIIPQFFAISANYTNYYEIPFILTMLLYCYSLTGLIHFVTSPQKMMRYVHEEAVKRIDSGCHYIVWTSGFTAAMGIVVGIAVSSERERLLLWLLYAVLNALAAATAQYAVKTVNGMNFVIIDGERSKREQNTINRAE